MLPTNKQNGMPIPFFYKARTAHEILKHLADTKIPIARFVNTIMAQPIGDAAPFCLAVFGSDNKYSSLDVVKRWLYISEELKKVGICSLAVSSDCDPKYSCAMRMNSEIGNDLNGKSMNGMFKCDVNADPPFYQDYLHLLTKLRNLLLKTIRNPNKLCIGEYFVQQDHLKQLVYADGLNKDKHLLTATDLNPADRQNVQSAVKICDEKVINLLKNDEKTKGTIFFLQIMSDVTAVFLDRFLSPYDRLERMWTSVFLVRIWKSFVKNHAGLTLKDNFMSSFTYFCIEQNGHSLVQTLIFLKKQNLTHLFIPYLFCSQPCESFFRNVRSLTSINSTIVNFSTKEILNRISRIQILSEISNDKSSGLVFPKTLSSSKNRSIKYGDKHFPNENEIIKIILKCKDIAICEALKLGLLQHNQKYDDSIFSCSVPPYIPISKKLNENSNSDEWESDNDSDSETSFGKIENLYYRLCSSSIKNYASKFQNKEIPETSSFVEVVKRNMRLVFRKGSIC